MITAPYYLDWRHWRPGTEIRCARLTSLSSLLDGHTSEVMIKYTEIRTETCSHHITGVDFLLFLYDVTLVYSLDTLVLMDLQKMW